MKQLTKAALPSTALFLAASAFLKEPSGDALIGVVLAGFGLVLLGLAVYVDWKGPTDRSWHD